MPAHGASTARTITEGVLDYTHSMNANAMCMSVHSGRYTPAHMRPEPQRDTATLVGTIVYWVCYLACALMITCCVFGITANIRVSEELARQAELVNAAKSEETINEELLAAREYNASIDPVETMYRGMWEDSSTQGVLTSNDDGYAVARGDDEYMNTLSQNVPHDVIATIRIPSISTTLPIKHTTDNSTLSGAVGHYYGSHLPTGEDGTLSVLAAHSGSVDQLGFTRLGELEIGDTFYITVLGEEYGYEIDSIRVVEPDDMESLIANYDPSESARITLLTCTPVGINTHRLLVSGVRKNIPEEIKSSDDISDAKLVAIIISAIVLVLLIIIGIIIWLLYNRSQAHAASASKKNNSSNKREHHQANNAGGDDDEREHETVNNGEQ